MSDVDAMTYLRTFVVEPGDPEGLARSANMFRDWGIGCARADATRELLIEHAEPKIQVPAEDLQRVAEKRCPYARLVPSDEPPPPGPPLWVPVSDVKWWAALPGWPSWGPMGATLRVEVGRTVIYRVTDYLLQPDVFIAEWPD